MPGLNFEDCQLGRIVRHPIRRTITEADNVWFSCLTMNPQPLHIDADFAARSEWGRPLVNSMLTLGMVVGISVGDTTLGTLVANLGLSEVKFPHPLFHGDTIHVTTEVTMRRDSRSRADAGIVEFEHKAFNQTDDLVAVCRRQTLLLKRNPVIEV